MRRAGVSVVGVSRWNEWSGASSTAAYDERWRRKAARGESIHGEADLLCWFEPGSVLDAGCGTGRVAVELDRRGVAVVGVDLDPRMLAEARRKAPHLRWVEADLCDVTVAAGGAAVPSGFDVVALAGNVMIFVEPGTEAAVVANMARHLRDGGRLVAGFRLGLTPLTLDAYDRFAADAGLGLEHRWSTWERDRYAGGDYAVSVHRS